MEWEKRSIVISQKDWLKMDLFKDEEENEKSFYFVYSIYWEIYDENEKNSFEFEWEFISDDREWKSIYTLRLKKTKELTELKKFCKSFGCENIEDVIKNNLINF